MCVCVDSKKPKFRQPEKNHPLSSPPKLGHGTRHDNKGRFTTRPSDAQHVSYTKHLKALLDLKVSKIDPQ